MIARIRRFLENDIAVAYMLLLIACMGVGGSWALFEARVLGWI
ncbi:MAG TPA: hypothetical protein PKC46_05735 [Sphingorhabdus sp.]|nr:hypothetical protein [Sphingorhabdus sp.]